MYLELLLFGPGKMINCSIRLWVVTSWLTWQSLRAGSSLGYKIRIHNYVSKPSKLHYQQNRRMEVLVYGFLRLVTTFSSRNFFFLPQFFQRHICAFYFLRSPSFFTISTSSNSYTAPYGKSPFSLLSSPLVRLPYILTYLQV